MRYSNGDKTSDLRTQDLHRGAQRARGQSTILERLHPPSLSDTLLASARGEIAARIAQNLGCGSQTVRNAIHEFNEKGLKSFTSGSSRLKEVHAAFDEEGAEALRELLHRVSAQRTLSQLACSAQEAV